MTFAIETEGLTRLFDGRVAVENLSLQVPRGSIFGFLGPNGAGKTTTVRMLAALIEPTSGTARVAGYELGRESMRIRERIGILTETPGLYIRLSGWENLLFFAGLSDLGRRTAAPLAERYLKMMELWERRNDPVSAYSKGMRQRLAICRALLHQPEVVFMDEPTSGLDPDAARIVRAAIKELREEGRTVFLSTHNMLEAEDLCDIVGIFATRLLHVSSLYSLRGGEGGIGAVVRVAGSGAEWLAILEELPYVQRAEAQFAPAYRIAHDPDLQLASDLHVTMDDPNANIPHLGQALAGRDALILQVVPLARSLESVYLELLGLGTGGNSNGRERGPLDASRGGHIPAVG